LVPKMFDIVPKMMKMGRNTKCSQHLTSLVLQQKYVGRESFMMVFTYKFVIMRKKMYKIIIIISLSWMNNMYWVETFYSILRFWEFYAIFQNFNKISRIYILRKP
jgi:hypothetical protein